MREQERCHQLLHLGRSVTLQKGAMEVLEELRLHLGICRGLHHNLRKGQKRIELLDVPVPRLLGHRAQLEVGEAVHDHRHAIGPQAGERQQAPPASRKGLRAGAGLRHVVLGARAGVVHALLVAGVVLELDRLPRLRDPERLRELVGPARDGQLVAGPAQGAGKGLGRGRRRSTNRRLRSSSPRHRRARGGRGSTQSPRRRAPRTRVPQRRNLLGRPKEPAGAATLLRRHGSQQEIEGRPGPGPRPRRLREHVASSRPESR